MQRNEQCKPGDEHPPATFYHRDKLECDSASSSSLSVLTAVATIAVVFVLR